ncbi:MAG: hypothetical protein L0332_03910, partial [Chloroflexi bacterium]|nr:hypothetical protein [Chloroflexota bacterium]
SWLSGMAWNPMKTALSISPLPISAYDPLAPKVTQRRQFLNEDLWKISPKSPEVPRRRSTEKQTRSRHSASGLINKQKPRVGIVGEQRLDVNDHQLLISEHIPVAWLFLELRHAATRIDDARIINHMPPNSSDRYLIPKSPPQNP